MTSSPEPVIIRAHVAGDGRLIEADAPLLELQIEAGGDLGHLLAVPQLAAVVRLALRLGVTLSRPLVAASERGDIDMWVQARPVAGGVDIAIVDWHERSLVNGAVAAGSRAADIGMQSDGWAWQIDTQLRFEAVLDQAGHDIPQESPAPGVRFSSYFHLQPDDDGDMAMLRGFAQRRAFRNQQAALVSDSEQLFDLSGFPLFDIEGRLTGFRGTARPLAMANKLEPRADAMPMLYPAEFGKRLDRSLRQPLGRIIANADTISAQLEGPLRPDYAGYAEDIATAGRHLMALVDDLADLQAIDRPDFSVVSEEVDLADLARRAAGLLSVKALDKRIRIIAPNSDVVLNAVGEFRRVLQVLVNLLGNAIRYGPEESLVQILVEGDERSAQVLVLDQGPGIAGADRERIFDKFERLGRSDSGGSGLGLYISRRLAHAMKGDIAVSDAPGGGACFTLTLPTA